MARLSLVKVLLNLPLEHNEHLKSKTALKGELFTIETFYLQTKPNCTVFI